MNYENWIQEKYEEIVSSAGEEGMPLEFIKQILAEQYADEVGANRIDEWKPSSVDMGILLFSKVIDPIRKKRRSTLLTTGEYIKDALEDKSILGLNDPILCMAFPLGDKSDKTMGFWTSDNWIQAANVRFRNADQASETAKSFSIVAQSVSASMENTGSRIVNELFRTRARA
jgi:hypothetical protein